MPDSPLHSDNPAPCQSCAIALWDLLDDIDTLDDMAKGDDAAFRVAVESILPRRFNHAVPDRFDRLVFFEVGHHRT